MSTSKLQRRVSQLLSVHMGCYTIRENIRPAWLETSEGQRLELDFYIEELQIGFEVQGEQHYRFTPAFHGDYQGFLDQQKRDKDKKMLCDMQGVTLIEVDHERDAVERILELSKLELPEPSKPVVFGRKFTQGKRQKKGGKKYVHPSREYVLVKSAETLANLYARKASGEIVSEERIARLEQGIAKLGLRIRNIPKYLS